MGRSLESFKNMMKYTDREKLVEMLYESCKQGYEMEEEIKRFKGSLEYDKKEQENFASEIITRENLDEFLERIIYELNEIIGGKDEKYS